MKKILIVNNNMKVGGVQKSLYNLLWALSELNQFEITLLLFSRTGAFLDQLPSSVRVLECGGPVKFLGKHQSEFRDNRFMALVRGIFALLSRIFGRAFALKLLFAFQPRFRENFDVAISFLHNGRKEAFYGGVQDYVLNRVSAEHKIAFLHCDYEQCGANHKSNNLMMQCFDKIAACSESCRNLLVSVLPSVSSRCFTVYNCQRFGEIQALAASFSAEYQDALPNVAVVARLTHEKGIERALEALSYCVSNGKPFVLHLIGDGPLSRDLRQLCADLKIDKYVFFHGEQINPYPYILSADLLLIPSYHEAAPMVIDESRALGVPVLSTQTVSADELVAARGAGWVCDNSQKGLNESLLCLLSNFSQVLGRKTEMSKVSLNNDEALQQFLSIL